MMLFLVALLCEAVEVSAAESAELSVALARDDSCHSNENGAADAACALHALQVRGKALEPKAVEAEALLAESVSQPIVSTCMICTYGCPVGGQVLKCPSTAQYMNKNAPGMCYPTLSTCEQSGGNVVHPAPMPQ